MCRISSLEEAQTVMLEIQMDSTGSEIQSVSFTYDKLIMRPTVATSAASG